MEQMKTMKRIFLILVIGLMAFQAYPQRFIGSVILGMNTSQVDGDEVYHFRKFGVNGGGSVMVALNEKQTWFATIELLYTQKGSYQKAAVKMSDTLDLDGHNIDYSKPFNEKIKYKLNLDYVEVPILFHYEDPRTGWALGLGASWGRLVNVKEIENGWRTTTSLRSGTYRKSDWSAIADLKIRLWKGLKLNFRYQYTFVPIRTRTYYIGTPKERVRKQFNNVITMRLIYSINEKYVPNNKYYTRPNRYTSVRRPTTRYMRDTTPFAK